MKRISGTLVALVVLATGCVSMKPVDLGLYDPGQTSPSAPVTLNLDSSLIVQQIDGAKVDWKYKSQSRPATVKLVPGVHTFSVSFNDGNRSTFIPSLVIADLVVGQEFLFLPIVEGDKVHFDIRNVKTKASVILDRAKLAGEKGDAVSTFIRYVLNPTMDETKHSVRLENDDLLITLLPDMHYEQVDKKTGTKTRGFHGFIMNFQMSSATFYLLETDPTKMTREEFLDKSNYSDTAKVAWTPVECSAKSVSFRVERPTGEKGKIQKFSLTEDPSGR